ncbi:MAG: 3-oxoadipate enol-lactonase [Steroidobacteraceae bacterium]
MSDAAIELEYECEGDAGRPPLLLLHALGSSLAMWDTQVAALAPHFHVVRYSMRGHGSSPFAGTPALDLHALAHDACAVLDRLGIERAHWCGLSLGGMVAMHAASRFPGRVARLALANTTAHFPTASAWSERMALVRERGLAPLADPTMTRWFTPDFHAREPGEVARIRQIFLGTDPAGYVAACAAIRDMDLRDELSRIRAPTLVLAGAADASLPVAHATDLQSGIAGARLLTLEAAHLSNIEARAAFTAALLAHFGLSS